MGKLSVLLPKAQFLISSSLTQFGRRGCTLVKPNSLFRVSSSRCAFHNDVSSSSSASAAAAATQDQTPYLTNLLERGLYNENLARGVTSRDVKNLDILDNGDSLEITWGDGHVSKFHAIWLRHGCHCEHCRLDHNGMMKIDFRDVSDDVRIVSARMEGDKVVVIQWESSSGEGLHEGPIPAVWLRQYCYSEEAHKQRGQQRAMKFYKKKIIPEVEFTEVAETDLGLYKWLTCLSEQGICLVKNVPRIEGMVAKMAERIAPIQHTIYGETFDVVSTPRPINAAYSSEKLDLHMDQPHYESPPGLQMLHCMEFDPEIIGGENTFGDIHEMAHKFREERPDLFDVLARVPIPFQTVLYNRDPEVHIIHEKPMFQLNNRKELVGIAWHPMLMGPLQVAQEDVKPFYQAYKYFFNMVANWPDLYKLRMVAGDMISFNNRRVLHGRNAFMNQKSRRFLQGTYVEISEFQSKVQVFHNLYGDGRTAMRCGSYSYQ